LFFLLYNFIATLLKSLKYKPISGIVKWRTKNSK
jgi:hypothetical protein